MFVCVWHVCAHPLTMPVMGSEPSQWKWQVEDIVFAGPFCYSVFHALVGLWLVVRSTYQGTDIDQVKNLNETLFIFLCFCGWSGPWKSQLVGPNNRHEVELQCGERRDIVCWVYTGKVPIRKELLGLSTWACGTFWLCLTIFCVTLSCFLSYTVECLRQQMCILIQWLNTCCQMNSELLMHISTLIAEWTRFTFISESNETVIALSRSLLYRSTFWN